MKSVVRALAVVAGAAGLAWGTIPADAARPGSRGSWGRTGRPSYQASRSGGYRGGSWSTHSGRHYVGRRCRTYRRCYPRRCYSPVSFSFWYTYAPPVTYYYYEPAPTVVYRYAPPAVVGGTSPPGGRPPPVGLADIKALAHAGLSDDVIISQIRNSRVVYRLTTGEIVELKESGVSEQVIAYMINTAAP